VNVPALPGAGASLKLRDIRSDALLRIESEGLR
jgi:hypothetical protein